MVVNSLVKAALAAHGSSDMRYPALRIVDYVDTLEMGNLESLTARREP